MASLFERLLVGRPVVDGVEVDVGHLLDDQDVTSRRRQRRLVEAGDEELESERVACRLARRPRLASGIRGSAPESSVTRPRRRGGSGSRDRSAAARPVVPVGRIELVAGSISERSGAGRRWR